MPQEKITTDSVRLRITSADTAAVLERIGRCGIALYDVEYIDELSVCVRCSKTHQKQIEPLILKAGGSTKVLKVYGPENMLRRVFRRPLVIAAILLLSVLVFFLPTRVLFIQVEGNDTIPTNLILEEAERCGITFGASRRWIRSEVVKNALVSSIPQLQWVGINTSGCVATISVREKSTAQDSLQHLGPGSIVAIRDGIIDSCTILNGTALCRVGEAVTAGQTLVSGYTDCGIALKAVRAEGEITAQTLHYLTAVLPVSALERQIQTHTETRYTLRIGKKLINFYKDSGISDSSCVKMYLEDYLTLPGGFRLPVALITQRCVYYDVVPQEATDTQQWLGEYCENYLLGTMQAGQILTMDTCFEQDNGVYTFHGQYVCLEMIGQFVNEEIAENGG